MCKHKGTNQQRQHGLRKKGKVKKELKQTGEQKTKKRKESKRELMKKMYLHFNDNKLGGMTRAIGVGAGR